MAADVHHPEDPIPRITVTHAGDDENYKRLFAFPRMVEDLLRAVVDGAWIDQIEFSSLRPLSAQYVGDDSRKRLGDTVWRVRFRGRWLHVLILLEFQSRDDPQMALRVLEYTTLLYRELSRNQALEPDGRWPPVLPIVLYNDRAPWTAALEMSALIVPGGPWLEPYQPTQRYLLVDQQRVREDDLPGRNLMRSVVAFEQSRTATDLVRAVAGLAEWLRDPRDEELRRAFAAWVRVMTERLAPVGEQLPPMRTLEEANMTLVERIGEWPKQWLREGREQGLEEGLKEGIEQQRALLCRLAVSRFGADVTAPLKAALARIADPDRLAEVGDCIIASDTADELLARVDVAIRDSDEMA